MQVSTIKKRIKEIEEMKRKKEITILFKEKRDGKYIYTGKGGIQVDYEAMKNDSSIGKLLVLQWQDT